jgi:diguanylate cyclase (GGDEF)-like protein/PAS domain S-box-containing protein
VLIVAAEHAEALFLEDLLRPSGFETVRIDRLSRALELLSAGGVAAVLLDLKVGNRQGLAALAALRRRAPGVPVLALADDDDDATALAAVRAGAQQSLVAHLLDERGLAREVHAAIERSRGETALRLREERLELAVSGSGDGVWDWHLPSNRVYFSPRWKAMLGFREQEVGESPEDWFDRVHPDELATLLANLNAHLKGTTSRFEGEVRMQQKDGNFRWVLLRGLALRDAWGKANRVAGTMTDVSDRKRAEERLLHDALHDGLTGLPNRALLVDRLSLALGQARRRHDYRFAVLFLDLDRFKEVNDSLGHDLGDELLVAIARRLGACLRPGDTVARLGGDEFAVILNDVEGLSRATRVAERVLAQLTLPFRLSGHDLQTSGSIGIALSSEGYERPEDILRDADTAMYRAKSLGRARFEVFDRGMLHGAVALHRLEGELRHAVERGEFTLHYQPIVSLVDGSLRGFEALVRWQHPQRGLIYPEEFLAVAEDSGLSVPIGWWVLREACRQARAWDSRLPEDEALSMSVNVSAKQFRERDMVAQVGEILAETGLDPRRLRLELTEKVLMETAERTEERLERLSELEVGLDIDDFGTGFTSLACLYRFPTSTVKIDRSFVAAVGRPDNGGVLVQTMVALARNLGMDVIAEGVETEAQREALRRLDCRHGQGYLFSRPLDAEAARALVLGRVPVA